MQCDFMLMRYVPDVFKDEFVNIGVMLLGRNEEFVGVHFTRDWSRVRCLDPFADIDILEELEKDLSAQLEAGGESGRAFAHRLKDTLSNSLQLTEPKALLSESPQEDLLRLAQTHLDRPKAKW